MPISQFQSSQLLERPFVAAEITGTWFGFYTATEIRKLSVKQITVSQAIDDLGLPVHGGLYDPALGPLEPMAKCITCGLAYKHCPGHLGHIELALPVYHPLLFALLYKIIRATCFACHNFRMSNQEKSKFMFEFRLLLENKIVEASRYARSAKSWDKKSEEGDDIVLPDERPNSQSELPYVDTTRMHSQSFERYKKLAKEFISYTGSGICHNCQAKNPSIRRFGMKLFELGLPQRSIAHNKARGLSVASPLEGALGSNVLMDINENDDGNDEENNKRAEQAPATNKKASQTSTKARYLTPLELKARLQKLFDNETEILPFIIGAFNTKQGASLDGAAKASIFFYEAVPVPPSRFRPTAKSEHSDRDAEHPQNVYLSKIIALNERIMNLTAAEGADDTDPDKILSNTLHTWMQLQQTVHYLLDNNTAPIGTTITPPGIKQLLEKKQGLFRQHMMGKRVNFAARSVISPDPYIETNEIGVPHYFAIKLNFPEPVTKWNYKRLAKAVENGPEIYPGANAVEDANGRVTVLRPGLKNLENRRALAKTLLSNGSGTGVNQKVHRHLNDGDVVIMNRQPTLHKPSMMAHHARVLSKERVLRMHYANCKTFNADFDGDEMNMHFPQSMQARAEAENLMFSDKQYIVPTNGAPIRGLIQDHIVTSVWITKRDTFFDREMVQQLLYSALTRVHPTQRIVLPPPAIIKPKKLWTGKQVISAMLQNLTSTLDGKLNLRGGTKLKASEWREKGGLGMPTEANLIIEDGELLSGVLDKNAFGAFGIIHSMYELYGPTTAGRMLSALGRLCTHYLQFHGFTCGVDDLIITKEVDAERSELLEKSTGLGIDAAVKFTSKDNDSSDLSSTASNLALRKKIQARLRSDKDFGELDSLYKMGLGKLRSDVMSTCLPMGQLKPFPYNGMALMTLSGAKGSSVNHTQISCLLGQQELEGKRVPVTVSGRTLPCFLPYDISPRAGGFVTDRFLTGLRPQEYFFHCMAGREGLIDTAVKTANSGYLQRCIIKHLEGLVVKYDYTVRDSDGSIVQFLYGGDALDPTKIKYMDKFSFQRDNYEAVLANTKFNEAIAANVNTTLVDRHASRVIGFEKKKRKILKRIHKAERKNQPVDELKMELSQVVRPDPITASLSPGVHLGCVSEKFMHNLDAYLSNWEGDHKRVSDLTAEGFRPLMLLKYQNCLIDPGEAVGILTGQSVGEPSTQMTLNTFHLAGHGGANVTLGIPRLREIIMTASHELKTPQMTLPLRKGVSEEQALELQHKLYCLHLNEIIREIVVSEKIKEYSGQHYRCYSVTFSLEKKKALKRDHALSPAQLNSILTRRFLPVLLSAIMKAAKSLGSAARGPFKVVEEDSEDMEMDEPTEDDSAPVEMDDDDESDEDPESARANRGTADSYDDGQDEDSSGEKSLARVSPATDVQDEELPKQQQKGQGALLARYPIINNYHFDTKKSKLQLELRMAASQPKILMLSLIETVCDKFVVSSIPNINRTWLSKDKSGCWEIVTEGVNLYDIRRFAKVIDIPKVRSNDIHAILKVYGVEAARKNISDEITNVFGAYGIEVDPRHLALLSDYMTLAGGYRPCNRMGIDSNVSPWLKMSFETTCQFLQDAAVSGLKDSNLTASAALVTGTVPTVGTNCFDVMQPLKM